MSERKAFWSSMPGFVTGAAGLLTALVGLLGLSVQLGWIGGGNSGGGSTTTSTPAPGSSTTAVLGSGTTAPGSSSDTGTPGGTGSTGSAQFAVDPTSVDFTAIGSRQATITVRNTGDVPLTVKTPTVGGSAPVHFVAGDVNCTEERLQPGRSCQMTVAFVPKSGGAVSAAVVIAAAEASRQVEVPVKATSLLG